MAGRFPQPRAAEPALGESDHVVRTLQRLADENAVLRRCLQAKGVAPEALDVHSHARTPL